MDRQSILEISACIRAGDLESLKKIVQVRGPDIFYQPPVDGINCTYPIIALYSPAAGGRIHSGGIHSGGIHSDSSIFAYILDQAPRLIEMHTCADTNWTLAHATADHGSLSALKYIYSKDPKQLFVKESNWGQYPSFRAARNGSAEILNFLAEVAPETVDGSVRDFSGSTLAHTVSLVDPLPAFRWLRERFGKSIFKEIDREGCDVLITTLQKTISLYLFNHSPGLAGLLYVLEQIPHRWDNLLRWVSTSGDKIDAIVKFIRENAHRVTADPDVVSSQIIWLRRYRLYKEIGTLKITAAPHFMHNINSRVLSRSARIVCSHDS